MTAKTTFHNPRLRSDRNGLVEAGDRFETDLAHARDLQRLDHAEPVESLDGREDPPLAPHIRCRNGTSTPTAAAGAARRP